MRFVFIAAALSCALGAAASAQDRPNAREAYVERRGLIEADTRCNLLAPSIHDALQVSAAQARGALLRAGWTSARMRELETAVVEAARARACTDPRTAQAAAEAGRSVAQWINAGSTEFPGWERRWIARRASHGWRLSQSIDAPVAATFGVLQRGQQQRLSLVIPVVHGVAAPSSARLVMRDPRRAANEVSLTARVARGLAAGLPTPDNARSTPSTRTLEQLEAGRAQAVFAFPDAAFRDLLALDPRESVEIHLVTGRTTQRLLIEVGDVAAARAFLTIRR